MRTLGYLKIIVASLYVCLIFSCNHPHSHDHNSATDDGHSHAQPNDHTHTGDDAHSHDQETSVHEHESGDMEDGHVHESEIAVDTTWEQQVGLKTETAQHKPIELLISAPGTIIPNPDQIAVVSPFVESSVNCAFVNVGDRVESGAMLACVTSPEIGILRAEYDKAKAELVIQNQNYERRRKLYDENIISEKTFQEDELGKKVAEVNYDYAKKKMLSMGFDSEELDNPPTGHSDAVGSTLHLHAPIAGVITERNASIGQKVSMSSHMFEIINLKTVWLEADIFEKDLLSLVLGQKVKVRVSAYPDDVFIGKIFYIGNKLDDVTKTVDILVEIKNESEKLKPGMFSNADIVIGKKADALVIPRNAVLEDEQLTVVFVKEEHGYHRHVVQLGIISDEYVEILSGLHEGDEVVTQGNYQLKSKSKMQGVDPHAGHVH